MEKNHLKVTIPQNKGRKAINPLIVILAFLLGVAAACAAFWRIWASKMKKRDGVSGGAADGVGAADCDTAQTDRELRELLRQLRREYERRESAERSERQQAHLDLLSVQTQKIQAYRPRKRVSGKKIFGRAVSVAVAAALVVTGLYMLPSDRVPVPTVQARESFGGIKQIVEEHNEDTPFVILDIVPGKAQVEVNGKAYDFSLGTIGYLAPGQSPIQKDLLHIFKGDEENGVSTDFYDFSAREKLTDAVIGGGDAGSGFAGLTYQEAYEGTGVNLKSSQWSRIFEQVKDVEHDADGTPIGVPTGRLYAKVEERKDGSTGTDNLSPLKGYDYNLIKSNGTLTDATVGLFSAEDEIYVFEGGDQGQYQVIFEASSEPSMSGYRVEEILYSGDYDDMLNGFGGSCSDATGVYIAENGVYKYVQTIGEFKGLPRPVPKPDDPEPNPNPETDPTDPDNPGGDPGTDPTDPDNPGGNTGDPGTDPTDPDNPGGDPGTDPTDPSNPGGDPGTDPTDPSNPGGDTGDPGTNPADPNHPGGGTGNPGENNDGQEAPPQGDPQPVSAPESAEQPQACAWRTQSVPGMKSDGSGWYLCVNTGDSMLLASTESTDAGTDETTPGTGETTPGTGETTPGTGEATPGTDQNPPETELKDPVPPSVPVPEDGTYCVLKFAYVVTEQEEFLYQMRESMPVGSPCPYDSYLLENGLALFPNGKNALGEGAGLDADSQAIEGWFEYVGGGMGRYMLTSVGKPSVVKNDAVSAENNAQDGQDAEAEAGQGIDAQSVSARAAVSGSGHYVEVLNAPVYIQCTGGEDLVRKHVFNSLPGQDNADDNFAISVVPALAGDLRLPEKIAAADLIYLEDGAGAYLGSDAKKYYISSAAGDAGNTENLQNVIEDVSDASIWGMMYAAVEESKPVIVDYGIIENKDDYLNSAYQRLARVFLKKDLDAYYYEFNKKSDFAANLLNSSNLDSGKYPDKTDNQYHYVNRNVYVVTELLATNFAQPLEKDKARAGFTEVLAAIRAENAILPEGAEKLSENISKAMAVQYIINYSLGLFGEYKDLSILELQPTANLHSDLYYEPSKGKEGGVLFWKRDDGNEDGQSILRSSKKIDAKVTINSVAAFNTSHQDINEDYNMIFIGLDGQRFYREEDDEGVLQTRYNNSSLNGKVYHGGDQVAGGGATYDANDITTEKKNELLDYLRAGYPIVVENDCFKGKSAKKAKVEDINEKYIAEGTQMYEFFEKAIELNMANQSENGEEGESGVGLYTIEDVHKSAMFVMQLTTLRPQIEILREGTDEGTDTGDSDGWQIFPTDQDREPGVVSYDISYTEEIPDKPGFTRGTIRYRIPLNDAGYAWKLAAHLYLDLNYDGVFVTEEEFTEYQHEQTADGGQISIDFNEVGFGFVPWKLEVRVLNPDNRENKYRRASAQGCFVIRGKDATKIRVLQILDDTENENANLQKQYDGYDVTDDKKDFVLAHFMSGAESLGIEWDIKTIALDGKNELKEQLEQNENYLSLWDVVVLGFGDSSNPGESVTKAVNYFIEAGGSVLVSSGGASADRLGLSVSDLGQSDRLTYGKLALNSAEKFRYEGIFSSMFQKTSGLKVERINESVITKQPYGIGDVSRLGDKTSVAMPDYLLDIGEESGKGQPYTTAWLTLSDTNTERKGGYSTSPRDGRNNYYVYSKGNVVYVGQSEYPYTYESKGGGLPKGDGVDECKIFVNALLAAYNGGVHRANVSIVAGFNGVNKVESITVPYDVAFKEVEQVKDADGKILIDRDTKGGILGDTVDVYFRFTDNNIAFNKTAEASFYCKNKDASANTTLLSPKGEINETDYTNFTDTTPIWMVENNRLVEVTDGVLVPGKVYRIKAPLEAMQTGEDETSQICVLLKNAYTRAGQPVEAFSMDSVSLNRAQMFLLE